MKHEPPRAEPELPSQIRRDLLAEHAELRDLLRETRVAKPEAIKRLVLRLNAALSRHMEHEESVLIPELAQLDAFARERILALQEEHAQQRALMDACVLALSESRPDARQRIDEACRRIEEDIADEEERFLSPKLLRDDIVTSGFSG